MTEGIFPDMLKTAWVIPLYKSSEKKNINNYRPISILSISPKSVKKIMYNYIAEFMRFFLHANISLVSDPSILHNMQSYLE